MSNKRISDLDAISTIDGADLFAIVDLSESVTKKITLNQLIATIIEGSTEIVGETVSGAGTSWALAHAPYGTTLRLFAIGQRLKLTDDYTTDVNGNITTVTSWPAGSLLADYVYTS